MHSWNNPVLLITELHCLTVRLVMYGLEECAVQTVKQASITQVV
jgi:hypothetical protein